MPLSATHHVPLTFPRLLPSLCCRQRSASAGDQSSGPPGALGDLSQQSQQHQPSPEVLRRAATSAHSDPAGDLSRPDISMLYQKQVRGRAPGRRREAVHVGGGGIGLLCC